MGVTRAIFPLGIWCTRCGIGCSAYRSIWIVNGHGQAVPLEQGVMRATNGLSGSANYEVSEQGTLVYARAVDKVSSTLVWVDRRGRATPFTATGLESPRISSSVPRRYAARPDR